MATPKDNKFLMANSIRKKQIADWFKELVIQTGNSHKSVRIIQLYKVGKFKQAFQEFHELVRLVADDINSAFNYIYEENASLNLTEFLTELFYYTYKRRVDREDHQPEKTKELPENVIVKEIEEQRPDQAKAKIVIGINKQGQQEKGKRIVIFDKGQPYYMIKSLKTGKFLSGGTELQEQTKKLRLVE